MVDFMIDFDAYNIKVRYFTTHPAGLKPDMSPFIVRHDKWWNGEKEMWENVLNNIKGWCETHRNQCLIVHELSPMGIRYTII
jgi:hypothetical protein